MSEDGFNQNEMDEARRMTERWVSQERMEPSCTLCCLYDMLYELSTRDVAPLDVMPSFKTVSNALEYSIDLGVRWDVIEPGMSKVLRKSKTKLWTISIKQNDRSLPIKRICDIIKSNKCSFPMMSLGPEYLRDEYGVELKGNPFHWFGHAVVIISCIEGDCMIFDPYAKQMSQDSIRAVSKERLNRHWYSTDPPRSLAWFERKTGVLEEYEGVCG